MLFNSQKIADLTAQLEAVNTEINSRDQEIQTLKAQLGTIEAECSAKFGAQLEALKESNQAEVEKLKAESAQALENAKAEFEARVNQEVVARVALAGADPVVQKDTPSGTNTKSYAEFSAMSQKERHEFFKIGGRING